MAAASAEEIASALTHRVRSLENPLSRYLVEGDELPEVIVIFVEPQIHTEDFPRLAESFSNNKGAFENLKNIIHSSKSSLVIPYGVSSTESFGYSIVNKIIMNLPSTSQIIVARSDDSISLPQGNIKTMTFQQLESTMQSKWEIYENGVTDLIVVYLTAPAPVLGNDAESKVAFAQDDAFVGRINAALKTNFIALFTSNQGIPKSFITSMPQSDESMVAFEGRFFQRASDNTNWPDSVIEALYVVAFLLVILFTGLCCTCSIQSDLRFDGEKLIVNVAQGNQ